MIEPTSKMIDAGLMALLQCTSSELESYSEKLLDGYTDDVKRVYSAINEPEVNPPAIDAARINERIRSLMASNAELVAALKGFLSIMSDSAEFESALLDQPEDFQSFVDAQQKRVDQCTERARAALAKAEKENNNV